MNSNKNKDDLNIKIGDKSKAAKEYFKNQKKKREDARNHEYDNSISNIKDYICSNLDELFLDNIPDSFKELPETQKYVFGTFCMVSTFCLLIYYITSNINDNSYLSVTDNPNDGGYCLEVPKPLTRTYEASYDGYWSSNEKFSNTKSIYSLRFTNYEVSEEEYHNDMKEVQKQVFLVGQNMSASPIDFNLLIWMTWAYEFINLGSVSSKQVFQFTGNPSQIFNRQYIQGDVANGQKACKFSYFGKFNEENSIATVGWSSQVFGKCSDILTPEIIGWSSDYGTTFQLSIDTSSFSIAAAINAQIYDVNLLEVVRTPYFDGANIEYNGAYYYYQTMIDIRFPHMLPIMCIFYNKTALGQDKISKYPLKTNFCFYNLGNQENNDFEMSSTPTLAIPLFNHFGYSGDEDWGDVYMYKRCTCPYKPDMSYCNMIDLMVSFLYFNRPSNITESYSLSELTKLHLDIITSIAPTEISYAAFNASFYSATPGLYIPENMKAIEKAFEFCNNCSIATLNMYDNFNTYITPFFYSLENGHCTDSVTSNQFNEIIKHTPEALVENYYECYNNEFTATFDSIGIAAGNVGLMLPFIVLALLPIIFLYLKSIGYTPPRVEYKKSEIEDYLSVLGVQLLRARDGKTRGWTKINKNLNEIAESLAIVSQLPASYPDSDDESDDESSDEGDEKDKNLRNSNEISNLQNFVRDIIEISEIEKPKLDRFEIGDNNLENNKIVKVQKRKSVRKSLQVGTNFEMVRRRKSLKNTSSDDIFMISNNPLHKRKSVKKNSIIEKEIIIRKFLNEDYCPLLEKLTITRGLIFVQSLLNDLEKVNLLKNDLQKMLKMNKLLIITGNFKILDIYNGNDSDNDDLDSNDNEDIKQVREIFVIISKIMQIHISLDMNNFDIELNNSLLTDNYYYNIGGKYLNGTQIIRFSL